MLKRVLFGLVIVGVLIAAPIAVATHDAPAESVACPCCGDTCTCCDCACADKACACSDGNTCTCGSCTADCCGSCCPTE